MKWCRFHHPSAETGSSENSHRYALFFFYSEARKLPYYCEITVVKMEGTLVSRMLTLLETCDFSLPVSNHSTLGNCACWSQISSQRLCQCTSTLWIYSATLYNDAYRESDTRMDFTWNEFNKWKVKWFTTLFCCLKQSWPVPLTAVFDFGTNQCMVLFFSVLHTGGFSAAEERLGRSGESNMQRQSCQASAVSL